MLGILGAGAWYLWSNKDHIALLNNNNLRISGDWYQVEMNFKQSQPYHFAEGIISYDGQEYGSYVLRKNTQLEVTVRDQVTHYELEFTDHDNMVWMLETKKGLIPSIRWRR